jgi:hypothetical protein
MQDLVSIYPLVTRDGAEDRMQRTEPHCAVGGYGDALAERLQRLNQDVTAFLMNLTVIPSPAKNFDEFLTRQISRKFHRVERTSSRTKCSLRLAGGV